jgi:hypothetical protein
MVSRQKVENSYLIKPIFVLDANIDGENGRDGAKNDLF